MKKSDILEAFKSQVMDKIKEFEDRFEASPSKADAVLRRSIFKEWGDTLLAADRLIKDSTSPAECEEFLLKMLDGPHLGDLLMYEFEGLFLDLVLAEVKWEDE